ncbi:MULTISPECIES: hypothetical protein [Protofrankia]|uniref:Glutamine amidotransferase type-2 domain-containing protein n=1 Tax=Candidatus Protofrankia datiscae TaxID=2716812 RepID=F8AV87_9ACTN|nr:MULTISPECIES: hypothetical protein [Protofrankia]AEH08179.1 hypothetical protein FsymDg_0654 [Candidatus Protofrankia datiscae]
MTVCGLLRLDDAPVRRSVLTAMLASSSVGLPPARGVHLDGPFGVVTASGFPGDPTPPIAVDAEGLVVVLDGCPGRRRRGGSGPISPRGGAPAVLPAQPSAGPHTYLSAGASAGPYAQPAAGVSDDRPGAPACVGSTDACLLAAAYRRDGERCLGPLGGDWVALIWEPDRRQLVCARTGDPGQDLLTWSDGRVFAFGTELAQLRAAGMPATAAGRPRPGRRLGRVSWLGPDERLAVRLPGAVTDHPAVPAGRSAVAISRSVVSTRSWRSG